MFCKRNFTPFLENIDEICDKFKEHPEKVKVSIAATFVKWSFSLCKDSIRGKFE